MMEMFLKSSNPNGLYAFTPIYTTSDIGAASANNGLPADYRITTHGQSIWAKNKGSFSSGWVGTKFTATTSTINLKFSSDNAVTVYVNGVPVLYSDNWVVWATASVTVPINSTVYLSLNVVDQGGGFGVAGYVKSSTGATLVKTSTNWVSA